MKRALAAALGAAVLALIARVALMPVRSGDEEKSLRVVRGAMHVHSLLSHDSKQSVAMIAADAKAAGLDLVVITDHDKRLEAPSYSPEGVLVVPAMEANEGGGHVLHIGDFSAAAHPDSSKAPLSDEAVIATQGYELGSGSTDFYHLLASPRAAWLLAYLVRPAATFAALAPERALGAARYDRLSAERTLRLICGTDDHGRIDSPERLLTYVTYFPTFIPTRNAADDADAVSQHLARGETYCALGIFGDASPLSITVASDSEALAGTGGEHRLPAQIRVRFAGALPPGHRIYLLKNGADFASTTDARLDRDVSAAGVYRVELGRDVPTLFGHRHIRWIYANPIYIRPGLALR